MTIEELRVVITAETAGLQRQIKNVQNQLGGLEKSTAKSCNKINSSFKNLFKGIGFTAVIVGLNKVVKSAIQAASDLEEVQNVVEVSFGSMTQEVEDFANRAVKSYGISTLTAKQMASTFMAMSNGMGIAAQDGKNMSLSLTALAADIASFYNVQTSVAQTALNSIFTGETESLKKFGVVLTEANLKAFALSQGIKKEYSAMSQAEKVGLRYNYVLQSLSKAQGDFARTSGSWANQTRILKEQWNQLIGILGKQFISLLTPLVKGLNKVLSYLIAIGNAIAKTFGGSAITGIKGGLDDAAAGAGDIASGLEESDKAAKKLNKTIASFDELETLAPKDSSSSGSSGSTGGGSLNIPAFEMEEQEAPELDINTDKIIQKIEDLKQRFKAWKESLPKLVINFDTEQAKVNLANIFENIKSTIANIGTTTISIGIKIANDLDIGQLSNDVLALIDTFSRLALSISGSVGPAIETFYDTALSDLVEKIGDLGGKMLQFINEEASEWIAWFDEHKSDINQFAENLGTVVSPLTSIFGWILEISWEAVKTAFEAISDAVRGIANAIIDLNIEDLSTILSIFLGIGAFKMGTEAGTSILSFIDMLKNGGSEGESFMDKLAMIESYFSGDDSKIVSGAENLVANLKKPLDLYTKNFNQSMLEMSNSTSILTPFRAAFSALGKTFSTLLGPVGLVALGIAAVVAAIIYLWNTNEDFRNWLTDFWNNTLKPALQEVGDALKKLWEEVIKPLWEDLLKPLLGALWEVIKGVWDKIANLIGEIIKIVGPIIADLVSLVADNIDTLTDILGHIIEVIKGIIDFITGVFSGDWKKAWEGVKKIFQNVFEGLGDVLKAPLNMVIGIINKVIKGINKIKLPNWGILGNLAGKGINIPEIPKLAKGGIVSAPTVAMIGEYPGANSNPEIVAPQNILRQTIDASNGQVVSALYQMAQQIIGAIDNVDMSVSIGDDIIAQSANRGNNNYRQRTGKPLFA